MQQTPKPLAQAITHILQPHWYGPTKLLQLARRNEPVLAYQSANLIALGRALFDQSAANAVNRLNVLLLDRLYGYETHLRPTHCLADGLCIVGVILVTLDIWLHKLRRNQFHRVASPL